MGDVFIIEANEDKFNIRDCGVLMKIENEDRAIFKAIYLSGLNKGKYHYLLPEDKVINMDYTATYSPGAISSKDSMKIVINHVLNRKVYDDPMNKLLSQKERMD